MPKSAKTVKVEVLKDAANAVLRDSTNEYAIQRQAIHCFMSNILMRHNAYRGFRYLPESEVPQGYSVGLSYDEKAKKNIFPDPTRTAFF